MYKIYIATALVNRDAAKEVRKDLQGLGYKITSRWIDWEPVADPQLDEVNSADYSVRNFQDILKADTLLVLTVPGQGTGHHIETGFALGTAKRIIVVGPITSIFQHLAHKKFPSWDEALPLFQGSTYEQD